MNSQESACLIRCPGEMCRLIFGHLLQEDLPAVCLSHRALRVHAEPLLYESVYFEWREECHHPITSFLRSILLRPQLAAYVRYFELTGGNDYDEPLDQAPKILLSESALEEPLVWVARRTNIPYRELWMEELRNGTMEAFIAVVISQTTNLEKLNIWPDFIRGTSLIGEALRSMAFRHADHGLPSQLNQLRDVFMRANSTSRDQTVDHYRNSRRAADLLLPFFYLPSVKRIEAEIDNPVELSWPTKQPPRSNATSLKLFHLRESFLAQILSTTESLQSLRWEWYYDDRFDDGYALTPLVDLTKLAPALRYVQDTLVELTIAKDCLDKQGDYPRITIQGSLDILSEFKVLKMLEFPLALQLGFSPHEAMQIEACLPIGLERLFLTDAFSWVPGWKWKDHDIVNALEVWLESAQTITPKLHSLELCFGSETYFYWRESATAKLDDMCKRAGIDWGMQQTYSSRNK